MKAKVTKKGLIIPNIFLMKSLHFLIVEINIIKPLKQEVAF